MENLNLIIAKNISELRKKQGLTQLELAEKLNYSDKAVSKWERAESIPDVAVLKEIADLFGVTLDYLVEAEHRVVPELKAAIKTKIHNRGFITGISILLVWLAATLAYVVLDIVTKTSLHWLVFVWAIPVSMVVWLVLNSVWFNRRRNFLIISFLMWSGLAALYLTLLMAGFNLWIIYACGVPGQIIILMWSRIKSKK